MLLRLLINVHKNAALQRKRDENCHVFADLLGNALKAVGQPLGTAKRVSQSHWEMPKDYWKPLDNSKRGIGKLLGNAQKPTISQLERKQNCPADIRKNMEISFHFL
jgi:hypothetical protein